MLMSDARDELDRLLKSGMPDAELIIMVPTDSGHTFFSARRMSVAPLGNIKAQQVRLICGLAPDKPLFYVQP